jgi:hypothetical protein
MDNSELNNLKEFREIPFSKLSLSIKHEKLLKRICNLNSSRTRQIPETIGGLLDLEPYDFSKIPAIGKSYVDSLITLKKELLNENTDNLKENEDSKLLINIDDISSKFCTIPSSLSELHLNYQYLKKHDVKLIEKLEKLYGSLGIEDILNCNVLELKGEKGLAFGAKHSTALKQLQDLIREEIIFIIENANKLPIDQARLLVSSKVKFYELSKIDEILIEDIETYLWSLDEKQQDIALSRLGFNHDNETLEEVGERHGLTRERFRQIEKQINTYLPLYFRIHSKVLWVNIRENMGSDLTVSLPFLAQCFETEKLFYSFIEICCQIKRGSLIEITLPKVQRRLLEPFFCLNPSPVAHNVIVEELTSEFGYSRALAEISIKRLVESDSIKITDKGIKPQNMGNKEAVAHVLAFHPEGLPWKDVAKIANSQNYAKNINEERLTHGFNDSDYIYLCSHGNYRNLMFLDLESFDFKSIMQPILGYFKSHELEALNLHDYFQQTLNERQPIEYFTLRHIVRTYGEEFGVYFNGRSGVDNVSVNKVSERVTQWDVVVQALNQSKGAMTKPEIAKILRSKSLNHASYYLNELMEENKVVRIDNQMFSTPEKAFKDINSDEILSIIKKLMYSTNKIVEADVFRKYVNRELNLSYSKYFYAALVGLNLKELGWHRTNNFISNTPLEYKNLLHVYKSVCQQSLSNAVNISRVKEILWLTDSVAANTLQQWKWLLKQ